MEPALQSVGPASGVRVSRRDERVWVRLGADVLASMGHPLRVDVLHDRRRVRLETVGDGEGRAVFRAPRHASGYLRFPYEPGVPFNLRDGETVVIPFDRIEAGDGGVEWAKQERSK